MSDRRPLWKQRTSFSKDRNVSVVLWPCGTFKDHPTPPSISIEEGKRDGETWNNTRITLTLDKAPNVIQNLQVAYAKALEIEAGQLETEAEVAEKETTKPTDPVAYLKTIILEAMKSGEVYPRMKLAEFGRVDDWVQDIQIQKAINALLQDGKILPKYEGLEVVGFRRA